MPAATLAIFDFDGTLANSLREVLATYNQLAPELGLVEVSSARFEALRRVGPREAMRQLDVPLWKVPRIMTRVRTAMRARMVELEPFAGVAATLHALWERGVKTAIVSSNDQENIQAFLTRHDLDHFDCLSCGVSLFGKASRLRKVKSRPEFAGVRAFYVGDEVRDVSAASEAGMCSVAVTWGYGEREALAAQRPDHLVHTPSDLVTILAPLVGEAART